LIQGGRIKITDFGMADLAARNRTDTGALVGETEYMAPEQFLSGTIDKRCDIHAVGTIFYELLTGKSPFRGDPHTAAAMFKVLQFTPPPPSQVKPGLPPAFDSLVGRALAKKPEQRLVNARLFRNELCAVYTTLKGRPPPESLIPFGVTPLTAGYDAPRTTIVQSRGAAQAPKARSQDQAGLHRASSVITPSKEPAKVSAPLRSESTASVTASLVATPRKSMQAGTEEIRAPPAPVKETAPASPLSPVRDPSLEWEELAAASGPSELTRVELRRSEPLRPAPLPGGTVLARPKLVIAPNVAVYDAAELPRTATPLEPAPAQPLRMPEAASDRPSSGSTVSPTASGEATASSREIEQEAGPGDTVLTAPERQDSPQSFSTLLPSAPAPARRPFAGPVEAAQNTSSAAARPHELGSPPADSMPLQRTRASSLPPKRIIPLTDDSIAHGGRVLAQFVGPIAMVFSRRAAQDAHDERVYFDMLAAHLSDPDERAQFFRKLRQRPA